uniref:Cytochrome c oxidase subunit 3 n=1 Tax=Arthrobotrys musiformis TaxID=47236 RepID=A0A482EC76_9PEZI|nr:cytochrome c oxidase subunit 3 [Arthrobotrys musiformis]QBM31538.1 cytochrome c oxidase subunit 3 [Arthrobotrys musiformis]QBM31645.1 cytochrome c oxidase subunit 3 [Arthrobotrys musiformis]
MTNITRSNFQAHPFHLVSPSPWPLFTSISLLTLTTSGVLVLTMHGFSNGGYLFLLGLLSLVASMAFWFRDVAAEGTYLGDHTSAVQRGLNLGVALFITSEALFFLSVFWAFFHSALSPTVELGAQWPPLGISAINPFELPLLNTVILLSSGITVTYAHHSLIQGNRPGVLYGLIFTIVLAVVFTICQGVEYTVSSFTLSDGSFGSCFYFGTGLTLAPIKFNVIIGTIFIAVGFWRILAYHSTDNHAISVLKLLSFTGMLKRIWTLFYYFYMFLFIIEVLNKYINYIFFI